MLPCSSLGFIIRRALLPALILTVRLIGRTAGEEAALSAELELEGYQAYARQVHDQLLPGVW